MKALFHNEEEGKGSGGSRRGDRDVSSSSASSSESSSSTADVDATKKEKPSSSSPFSYALRWRGNTRADNNNSNNTTAKGTQKKAGAASWTYQDNPLKGLLSVLLTRALGAKENVKGSLLPILQLLPPAAKTSFVGLCFTFVGLLLVTLVLPVLPPELMGGLCSGGAAAGDSLVHGQIKSSSVVRKGPLLKTAADVPNELVLNQAVLVGKVVNVSDGDTVRVLHSLDGKVDGKRHPISPEERKTFLPLRDNTILVRIYAVDAPETAKFGNPGQPFAKEATDLMKEKLYERYIYLRILGRDQYSRIIGRLVYVTGDGGKERSPLIAMLCGGRSAGSGRQGDVAEDLLKKGYACMYRGRGAEYDGPSQRDRLEGMESTAKKKTVGIWSISEADRELPSEYKASIKKARGG